MLGIQTLWVLDNSYYVHILRVLHSTIDLAAMQQYVLPPNSNYSNKVDIDIITYIYLLFYSNILNISSHRSAVVDTVIDTFFWFF